MSPTLIARVDGLPAVLLDREQVWPVEHQATRRSGQALSPKARARIERQTAVVHAAAVPRSTRQVLAADTVSCSPFLDAEAERSEILLALEEAGLR
jgi:hypothetical protein